MGGLGNPDGVRCWLPCLDSPQHRCIFDVTVELLKPHDTTLINADRFRAWARTLTVAISGVEIPSCLSNVSSACSYRYFTVHKICAANLGVFVGNVTVYKSLVYGTQGFVCHEKPFQIDDSQIEDELVNSESDQLPGLKRSSESSRGDSAYLSLPNTLDFAFIGFEQASRYLQRSLGRRYQHRSYIQVIVKLSFITRLMKRIRLY